MADYGTLNGQPVGPHLPDPVPCERCGHPVWLGKGIVAFMPDPLFPLSADRDRDRRVEMPPSVWELALPVMPGSPWSLNPHMCHRPTSP